MSPKKVCRVCLGKSKDMVNIFHRSPVSGISIAAMITHCTGLAAKQGDLFPEFICPPCLKEARTAFGFQRKYKRNYKFYSEWIKEDNEKDATGNSIGSEDGESSSCGTSQDRAESNNDDNLSIADDLEIVTETLEELFQDEEEEINIPITPKTSPKKCIVKKEIVLKNSVIDLKQHEELLLDPEEEIKKSNTQKTSPKKCIAKKECVLKNSVKKEYTCCLCSKNFGSRTTLRRHMYSHTGGRPHKCTHCPKEFILASDLERHIRTHTGERPFKCNQCSKAFARNGDLQIHIRIHTDERPYKCSECPKTFRQKSHRDFHCRTHASDKPFRCVDCPKTYSRGTDLRRHIRTHMVKKT